MKKKNAQQLQDAPEKEKAEAVVEAAVKKEEEKEEKKSRKVLNTVINVILIIAIVVAVIATYVSFVSTSGNGVPNIFGLRLLSIQTDSMYPTIDPGDLVIATEVKDLSALRPRITDKDDPTKVIYEGDIITYWTVINGERVLNTHRIVGIYDGGGYLIFQTKGDNNTLEDPLTVHESEVVGQYKAQIPGVGKVFDYLQTSTGFLIVVVIPVFLFFLFHLVQFFRVLFEYQNVKNRIKYEQERGRTEDLIAAAQTAAQNNAAQNQAVDRAAIEAELREKLRAELLASMAAEQAAAAEKPADGESKAEPAPAKEGESAETTEK
ncbi:MAG: signal peptidase I [Clostridia bacterium]|nr:signal peptidase I [Clostridia bacterium]